MSEDTSKKRLGRGLAALIGEIDQPSSEPQKANVSADRRVPIEHVSRNPRNPRREFNVSDLEDLSRSIRQHGIVQPVVVRTAGLDRYEIIAGERRWRAAQMAGLVDIPVIVRNVDDKTALEIAIVENVQRADLNPLEEAQGYEQLIATIQLHPERPWRSDRQEPQPCGQQPALVEIAGGCVADGWRQANCPPATRGAIVSTSDPVALAKQIVDRGLSVRDAERMAQKEAQQAENRQKR